MDRVYDSNFERWMMERHVIAEPTILDDDLPDAFDAWIGNMSEGELAYWRRKFQVENS